MRLLRFLRIVHTIGRFGLHEFARAAAALPPGCCSAPSISAASAARPAACACASRWNPSARSS
jgi:hypothetical protein